LLEIHANDAEVVEDEINRGRTIRVKQHGLHEHVAVSGRHCADVGARLDEQLRALDVAAQDEFESNI
jgi:hypothetical protein